MTYGSSLVGAFRALGRRWRPEVFLQPPGASRGVRSEWNPYAGPHMRLKHTAWAVPPHNFSHPCLPSIRPRLNLLGAIAPARSFNTLKVQPPKSIITFWTRLSGPHSYEGVWCGSYTHVRCHLLSCQTGILHDGCSSRQPHTCGWRPACRRRCANDRCAGHHPPSEVQGVRVAPHFGDSDSHRWASPRLQEEGRL